MQETLFALVLIFSPTVDHWTEEVYRTDLPFTICDTAQRAVWAQEAPTIGYDHMGLPIPAFDAYCVSMDNLPTQTIMNYFSE